MLFGAQAGRSMGAAQIVLNSVRAGVQSGVDRTLSVGYGLVYDFIFERFTPYQRLLSEIMELAIAATPAGVDRRHVRILDLGCGPGNVSLYLAEAGFSVLGIDPYGALVELAREKRRAKHLAHLAFQQADLARAGAVPGEPFDVVVNVHSLYAHPAPDRLLEAAHRVLRPGGHAIFINFSRRIPLWSTFEEVKRADGWRRAFGCLLWVLPNAIFEATRKRVGPHYWAPEEFSARLKAAGFTVMAMRPTFFNGVSLLALARKDTREAG